MASGFFALFDDIAALMDDMSVMTKIAAKKTAGVLGDDLAVNAEKASGFASSRELPVLWKITKGSIINKIIILPIAFLLSAFAPKAIIYILLIGGVYLAYEGAEKIYEYIFHKNHKPKTTHNAGLSEAEIMEQEKAKVRSAIFVDFILSIEVVIIALSTVVGKPMTTQIVVVTIVAFVATIGIYGIVALLVRMDDFGVKLMQMYPGQKSIMHKFGAFLVTSLPYVIKALSVLGTIAMLLVAGGIFMHRIHYLHDLFSFMPVLAGEFVIGLIVGFAALGVAGIFSKIKGKKRS